RWFGDHLPSDGRHLRGHTVEPAGKSHGWGCRPALRFGQAVIATTSTQRVLLSRGTTWKELEDCAGVVVETANEVRVEDIVDLRRIHQALHERPVLSALRAQVVGDAGRFGLERRVLHCLAVEQAKRVPFQALL